MKKKLKKALMAGAAAAALGAARNKSLLAATEDGKGGIDTIQKAKQAMTSDAAYSQAKAMNKKGLKEKVMDAIKVFKNKGLRTGPGPNATSKMGGTLAGDYSGIGLGSMDGAKYGKMIKASHGTYVKASCKMGRNKPTKIT
jgi:hypothetical protein